MLFSAFSPSHGNMLRAVFQMPGWQKIVEDGRLQAAREQMLIPPRAANAFRLPTEQLTAINGARVHALIEAGENHEDSLVRELGRWPDQWPEDVPLRLSFVGLNLTFRCDMEPRCVYCNQRPVAERLGIDDWKALLRDVVPGDGEGPYIYITGGEPLLLGKMLWGHNGLVRMATERGAPCNINTNGLGLTPEVAVALVESGLSRVHLSLDSPHAYVQDAIHQKPGRWAQVLCGLYNLQVAKTILGAEHPVIHINCVLTRLNAEDFPDFLRFLLEMKPLVEDGISPDLDLHVIPVGGEQNRALRLTAEGYRRFFTDVWRTADEVWQEYQAARSVPEDKRGALHEKIPFLSPYHRVSHRGSLEEWAEYAAEGRPGALAITERCYVCPTQGFVLPDGSQYWCGGHAISRPAPVDNILERGFRDALRGSIGQVAALPSSFCSTCPGATLAINQSVEASLRRTVREWLGLNLS